MAFRYLDGTVYPSEQKTMAVIEDDNYGGAHRYYITNCEGFHNNETVYTEGLGQIIQFVQKLDDGGVVPGVQSEQLVLMLLDRHEKLNNRFPSDQYNKMKQGLEMFLEACQERVSDRLEREVLGELKS